MKYLPIYSLASIALTAAAAAAGSPAALPLVRLAHDRADYAIVHAVPKDPTDNDFYLVCHGGRDQIDLTIRAVDKGGYGLETETGQTTAFVFGRKRIPATATLRGPNEMLGGITIQYSIGRGDPVLAAIARGEPFSVALAKTTSQLFSPEPARRFFEQMAAHCKAAAP